MYELTGNDVLRDFNDVGRCAELRRVVIFILDEEQTSTTAKYFKNENCA